MLLIAVLICIGFALFYKGGDFLLTGFAAYIGLTKQDRTRHNNRLPESASACTDRSCKREWALFFLGGVMLYGGGEIIFRNALAIVERVQISESVVGLTVIAVGTSIPDCAASIIAVTKNHKGIAVGNILGSNIFNIFLVLGATIIAFNDPIFFSSDNLYDYLSVSILSLFFFLAVLTRPSCGRLLGAAIMAYYPISLMSRMLYVG